jgi:hypothetical protein
MNPDHRVLVAVSPPSQHKLHALFDGCQADYFESYADATAALARCQYAAVVVGLHFGESRMFEFIRDARRLQQRVRVVCIQGTAGHLGESALASARTAAGLLGAEGVIDLSRLSVEDCRIIGELLRLAAPSEVAAH